MLLHLMSYLVSMVIGQYLVLLIQLDMSEDDILLDPDC